MANALLDLILQSLQPKHQGLRNALTTLPLSQNFIDAVSTPGMQHPTMGGADPWSANRRGDRRGQEVTRGYKQDLGSQHGVNYGTMGHPLLPGAPENEFGYIMTGRPEGEMTQDDWRKLISDWYQNRVQGMR